MKVLLIGANGQLGCCIIDNFSLPWILKTTDHSQLDITNKEQTESVINDFQPNVIINAAAYTAVDKAEKEPEKADLVNHIGPKCLAELAQQNGIRLIHISTDYVFDGKKQTPYQENDPTNPINVYGKTKLLGEEAVLIHNPSAVILRTSWVFSEYGNNFVKTMLRLAKERKELAVVADQFGCPTYAGDLAKAIIFIIERNLEGGVYHYCGDRAVSWYEFAKMIFAQASNLNKLSQSIIVHPLTTEQYPTLAKRPNYSVMDNHKMIEHGLVPSNWRSNLIEVITRLKD